jgi:hypothetical protein
MSSNLSWLFLWNIAWRILRRDHHGSSRNGGLYAHFIRMAHLKGFFSKAKWAIINMIIILS